MLRVDPAQVPRLLAIEANTHERLAEARTNGWQGEVVALEEGLRHIDDKKAQVERANSRSGERRSLTDAVPARGRLNGGSDPVLPWASRC